MRSAGTRPFPHLRASLGPALLLAVGFAALYFGFRAAGQTPDGLSYARAARDGVDMVHPHHLAYVPVVRLLHVALRIDPIVAGVVQNLGWLLVLGVAAARWSRRWPWTPTHGLGALGALGVVSLLLACRGVLFYSTHVETYLGSVACLAMFAAAVTDPRARSRDLAIWLVLAVLYHQTNVLIVPAMLAVSKNLRRDLLRVFVPAGGVTFALYVVAWRIEGAERGLFSWMLSYAHADVPAWGRLENFSPGGLAMSGASQLRMIAPVPESFETIAAVAFWIVLAALVAHHVPRLRGDGTVHRRFALIWLAVYLPFFLWWMPSDPDFFLATLLPLWMLAIAILAERMRGLRAPIVGGIAAVLLAGNLATTGRTLHASAGPAHAVASALARSVPADAVLVVDYGVQQHLLYHFAGFEAIEVDQFLRRVRAGMPAEWSGRPLVLGLDAIERLVDDEESLRIVVGHDPDRRTLRRTSPLSGAVGWMVERERTAAEDWISWVVELRGAIDRVRVRTPL